VFEDEEGCEETDEAVETGTWCYDDAKYPAETELEVKDAPGTPIGVIIGIVVAILVVLVIVTIIACKRCK
jgi:hypothetical protein